MGTNYYARINICKDCGRYDEIHVGKSSAGWVFSFQYNGGKFYKNISEMKKWLKSKRIFDEYDEEISYDEFWEMVKEKQRNKKNRNHAESYKDYPSEQVIGGYSFSDVEFC